MNDQQAALDQPFWLEEDGGLIEEFTRQLEQETHPEDVPFAEDIRKKIPVYHGRLVRQVAADAVRRRAVMREWIRVLSTGAGILVVRQALSNPEVIDRATQIFSELIEQERAAATGGGDHFAEAGANDRIWNALEKHCLRDPGNFARYFSCDAIAMGAEAWLGPGYQVTAQVNRVNPGGEAQQPHRDYHLGFMQPGQAAAFPAHVHTVSPYLTLQGSVIHCDMPIESGPTEFLPFSHHFLEGYLAVGREDFRQCFARNRVQLPLEKGDVVFFNPAIMHAAGRNTSRDIYRIANLLQISSAFGRSIETVDRNRMSKILYPVLLETRQNAGLSRREMANAVHACAEGYSFPTNLDRDPPIGGMASRTPRQLMLEALETATSPEEFSRLIDRNEERRQTE